MLTGRRGPGRPAGQERLFSDLPDDQLPPNSDLLTDLAAHFIESRRPSRRRKAGSEGASCLPDRIDPGSCVTGAS